MSKCVKVSTWSLVFDCLVEFEWHFGTGVNVYIGENEVDYFNVHGITIENINGICEEHLKEMEEGDR